MKMRVEFEPRPVRHVAVQCPECKKWFAGRDITEHDINDEIDLEFAHFECPVCNYRFGYDRDKVPSKSQIEIIECGSTEEVYHGCLRKKEVWE